MTSTGAVLGFAQELARYAVGRASEVTHTTIVSS